MQLALFAALAVAGLAVVFALQNNALVTLSFIAWTFQSSLAVVLMVTLVAGAFASFLASLPGMVRLKMHLRTANHRVAELEAAVAKAAVAAPAGAGEQAPGPKANTTS